MGLFSKIKEGLKKTKETISYRLNKLFTGGVLNDEFYDELEETLIVSDVGSEATERILDDLRDVVDEKHIRDVSKVREELAVIIENILDSADKPEYNYPLVIMISGVNGVGKTTTIGKLAHKFMAQKKTVTIAAADTFRAAAAEQLTVWADRAGARIIKQGEGSDPAAVVFDAIASVKSKGTDVLLIDTAGRLHNKANLMNELNKIGRVVRRELPSATFLNYLVIDATTGQNGVSQAELFNESTELDGIVLTKLDGTAKGGIVLAITEQLQIPVVYVGVGEGIDDLIDFDSKDFAMALMSE